MIHNCCAFGTADLQQSPPLGSAAGAAAGAEAGAEAGAVTRAEAGAVDWAKKTKGQKRKYWKRRQSGKGQPGS